MIVNICSYMLIYVYICKSPKKLVDEWLLMMFYDVNMMLMFFLNPYMLCGEASSNQFFDGSAPEFSGGSRCPHRAMSPGVTSNWLVPDYAAVAVWKRERRWSWDWTDIHRTGCRGKKKAQLMLENVRKIPKVIFAWNLGGKRPIEQGVTSITSIGPPINAGCLPPQRSQHCYS